MIINSETQTIKGPSLFHLQENLEIKINGDEILLLDDAKDIKYRITGTTCIVIINGQNFYFKNGKLRLKAFW